MMHSLWKVYFVFIFSFTVLFSLFTKVNAQTNKIPSGDSTVYQNMEIEFKTGLIIYGNIVYQNDSILILYSNEYKGTVTIEKSKIVPLKYPYDKDFIKELKEKKHFLDYSTGAFGINLRKGLGYYQNAMLVLNSFNVGVTKNIVIGGGFELSSFFRRSPVFFLTPRLNFEISPYFYLATGYYHININLFSPDANSNNIPDVNIVYFDLTLGNAKAYFSAGYGKDLKYMGSQFVSSNGFVRFGRKIGMASQIWLIPEPKTFYIIYLGPQINGKHNQFNFGVILTSSFNRNVYFPYLSYIYRF